MKELTVNNEVDVFLTNENGEVVKVFESISGVAVNNGEYSPKLQLLYNMLQDFTYRTVVEIVDFLDGKQIFKGTVEEYCNSDLKNKEIYIEHAEVHDGEFVITVRP